MKNPAEELVTAWLQECCGYFTMNNIKVPKATGGMGAEIDILATGKEDNLWVEVSVSTNPRCNFRKDVRFRSTVAEYLKDFDREDKRRAVAKRSGKRFRKWLVHGNLPISMDEIRRFRPEMRRHGVEPIYFGRVFTELRALKQYRLDSARGYMNLFEAFHSFASGDDYFERGTSRGMSPD